MPILALFFYPNSLVFLTAYQHRFKHADKTVLPQFKITIAKDTFPKFKTNRHSTIEKHLVLTEITEQYRL